MTQIIKLGHGKLFSSLISFILITHLKGNSFLTILLNTDTLSRGTWLSIEDSKKWKKAQHTAGFEPQTFRLWDWQAMRWRWWHSDSVHTDRDASPGLYSRCHKGFSNSALSNTYFGRQAFSFLFPLLLSLSFHFLCILFLNSIPCAYTRLPLDGMARN